MKDKPYHHGNLRNELIEAGITLLSEEGLKEFSLRKIAAKCNVSHTAPYSHFKNIESLNQAMGEYVTEKFMEKLQNAVKGESDNKAALELLGKAYISFFMENPHYFQFLFYYSGISINLDDASKNEYKPFAFFKEMAYKVFDDLNIPKDNYLNSLVALWSMVHGIASLATSKDVHYSQDWTSVLSSNIFNGG